jgi:hypothetical protein
MEVAPSTRHLTHPIHGTRIAPPIPLPFAFKPSQPSCCKVSVAALLWTGTRNNPNSHLFRTISETLYPSRLISLSRNPSLCPTSPKRWVLETPKTCKTEVNREQRSETQRHRGTVGYRSAATATQYRLAEAPTRSSVSSAARLSLPRQPARRPSRSLLSWHATVSSDCSVMLAFSEVRQ